MRTTDCDGSRSSRTRRASAEGRAHAWLRRRRRWSLAAGGGLRGWVEMRVSGAQAQQGARRSGGRVLGDLDGTGELQLRGARRPLHLPDALASLAGQPEDQRLPVGGAGAASPLVMLSPSTALRVNSAKHPVFGVCGNAVIPSLHSGQALRVRLRMTDNANQDARVIPRAVSDLTQTLRFAILRLLRPGEGGSGTQWVLVVSVVFC